MPFKILVYKTNGFKILSLLKILTFQNPELKISVDFKILAC